MKLRSLFAFLTLFFVFSIAHGQTVIRNFADSFLLTGHTDIVSSLAVSPVNEGVFASSGRDGQVIVWDWQSKTQIWNTKVATDAGKIAYSNRGKILAYSGDYKVFLVSTSDWKPHQTFDMTIEGRFTNINYRRASCMAFSPDDSLFAAGFADEFMIWETDSGKVVGHYYAYGNLFGCEHLQFSKDGRRVFGVSHNASMIWNLAETSTDPRWPTTPAQRTNLEVDGHTLDTGALSPDASFVAFAMFEKQGKLFIADTSTGEVFQTIRVSAENINTIQFSNDGCCLLVGSSDGSTRIFEVSTRNEISRLDDTRSSFERSQFNSLATANRTGVVISGDHNGEIRIWKPQ